MIGGNWVVAPNGQGKEEINCHRRLDGERYAGEGNG